MPHFPKPFFKKARGLWYVQLNGRQVNLGPDAEAAQRQYHELMQRPKLAPAASESLAAIADVIRRCYRSSSASCESMP